MHAKDDDARVFYERFGFVAAPTDPYHSFVLLKDVRAAGGILVGFARPLLHPVCC